MPVARPRVARRGELIAHVLFSIRTAVEAVGHNKLRAALTSLGILFGVASVIAMLAIGKGAEQEILEQMRLLGSNNVIITPLVEQKEGKVEGRRRRRSRRSSRRASPTPTPQAIRDVVPDVEATSGEVVLNTHHHARRPPPLGQGRRRGHDATSTCMNLTLAEGARFAPTQVERRRAGGDHRPRRASRASSPPRIRSASRSRSATVAHRRRRARGPAGLDRDRRSGSASATRTWTSTSRCRTMLLRFRNRAQVTAARHRAGVARVRTTTRTPTQPRRDEQRAERPNYHQLDRIIVRVDDSKHVHRRGRGRAADAAAPAQRRSIDFEITRARAAAQAGAAHQDDLQRRARRHRVDLARSSAASAS